MKKHLETFIKGIIFGLGFFLIFGIGYLAIKSRTATNPGLSDTSPSAVYVNNNEPLSAAKRNSMVNKQVPIGSIVAWHKSMPGTTSLPDGWAECNGQTLSDSSSPYNGQTMPDLNNGVYTGSRGRYLRGGTTSGLLNESTQYTHNGQRRTASNGTRYGADFGIFNNNEEGTINAYYTSTAYTWPHFQVTAMTVVWIMRIK